MKELKILMNIACACWFSIVTILFVNIAAAFDKGLSRESVPVAFFMVMLVIGFFIVKTIKEWKE